MRWDDGVPHAAKLHRIALKRSAEDWRYVVDGKPLRFTEDEARRLAFLLWRIEVEALDPAERL